MPPLDLAAAGAARCRRPVWFIVVIVIEVGLIHPPVGLNLFVIQAHAPDIKITSIYRGIVHFLVAHGSC